MWPEPKESFRLAQIEFWALVAFLMQSLEAPLIATLTCNVNTAAAWHADSSRHPPGI